MTAQPQFDLDILLKINYEYEPLKKVLEYLLKRERETTEQMSKFGADLEATQKDVKIMKITGGKGGGLTLNDLAPLKEKVAKLEERVYTHDEKFVQQQTIIDTTSFNLQMIQMSVNSHEEKLAAFDKFMEDFEALRTRVDELERMLKEMDSKIKTMSVMSSGGGETDFSKLESLINGLKAELFEALVKKEDFNELKKRVVALEGISEKLKQAQEQTQKQVSAVTSQTEKNTEEIEKLKERVKQLEEQMATKVDCEEFDKLLALVNQLQAGSGGKAPAPTGPMLSTKDMNLLKEIMTRFPEVEAKIKELFEKLGSKAEKRDVDMLRDLVETLRNEIEKLQVAIKQLTQDEKGDREEILKLKTRMDLLETKLTNLTKIVTEIGNKSGKKEPEKNIFSQNTAFKIEEEEWSELKKTIEKIKKDILDIFKELETLKELRKKITAVEGSLEGKLDKEEFENWKLNNDINQILNGILKKFADKNEMFKIIKKLEYRLSQLEESLLKEVHVDSAENAMLAKKPLGGWSCASCTKDLINIEGKKVAYYPWAKLPMRNPTDRIAKVGQGFSRMLSMLKPDLIAKSQQFGGIMEREMYEEDPKMPMGDEGIPKAQAKTHGQGFGVSEGGKRPNTAQVLPNLPHGRK